MTPSPSHEAQRLAVIPPGADGKPSSSIPALAKGVHYYSDPAVTGGISSCPAQHEPLRRPSVRPDAALSALSLPSRTTSPGKGC